MTIFTTDCNQCNQIKHITQFHFGVPYCTLVLDCNHKIKVYIPQIHKEQEI